MNKKQLDNAINNISDKYLTEALEYRPAGQKKKFSEIIKENYGWAIAACFCICVLGVYAVTGGDYRTGDIVTTDTAWEGVTAGATGVTTTTVWESVCNFFEGFVLWVTYAWFWIVSAAVIVIVIVYMIRHRKPRRED